MLRRRIGVKERCVVTKQAVALAQPRDVQPESFGAQSDNKTLPDKTVILVVDDDPMWVEAMRLALESAEFTIIAAGDGFEALYRLQSQPVDLILADVTMPGMNGYQLLRQVGQEPAWSDIPFIFLSSRDLDSDIRYGKELGVDDYLTKPVQYEDLLAAVRGKLMRARQRSQARTPASPVVESLPLRLGRLSLDPLGHRTWVDGQIVRLSAREFKMLEYLARHGRQVISPQELVRVTHSLTTDPVDAGDLLRPLVRSLRRKLGVKAGQPGCIENVRGVGYRLLPLL